MNISKQTLKRAWPIVLYMVVYLAWFFVLESKVTTYKIIHTGIDDVIPFCEFFVIPYYLWFLYVVVCVVTAMLSDEEEYRKTLVFLITGMTVFLLISTLWPNGHNLRPMLFPRDNMCTRLVAKLYLTDTPTNLWPSIHVYNSIGAHLCIEHCSATKNKKWIRITSFVICVSIILSTMFIKQHSLFDVCTAFIMALAMATSVYGKELKEQINRNRVRRECRVAFK